jgi:hypothetical protein
MSFSKLVPNRQLRFSIDSIFASLLSPNPYTNYEKNPTSWWPFLISDFSRNSPIWHVLMVSNILTQYGNNRSDFVVTVVINRQNCNCSSISNFRFLPISFAAYLSDIPTSMQNIKRICQLL